ncbi:MAG TPA: chalcone isomerase family protein [Minicystis sp.]|nr:chalcone isomerase family protein [Minicystis sp.]
MSLRSKAPLALLILAALFTAFTALALDKGADGYYRTGSAIRVKTVVLVDVKVYSITHYMKELPPTKSKRAVIDMDTGKKFSWTMLRDVDRDKIVDALKEAFAKNGYGDQAKISRFIGAFSNDLKENQHVTIVYDADSKNTTVTVQGGGSATINGVDFMKGVWSIWFGNIDQKSLGDQLISAI